MSDRGQKWFLRSSLSLRLQFMYLCESSRTQDQHINRILSKAGYCFSARSESVHTHTFVCSVSGNAKRIRSIERSVFTMCWQEVTERVTGYSLTNKYVTRGTCFIEKWPERCTATAVRIAGLNRDSLISIMNGYELDARNYLPAVTEVFLFADWSLNTLHYKVWSSTSASSYMFIAGA